MTPNTEFMQYRFEAGKLDSQTAADLAELAKLDYVPFERRRVEEIRTAVDNAVLNYRGHDLDPVKAVHNIKITGPEDEIPLRIYVPDKDGPFPVLLFFHGGGWVFCNLDTHEGLCRVFANRVGCLVVAVDYRLAPEHKYPAAVDDAYASLIWTANHIEEYKGDPKKIGVCGDSSGGNIAAALSIKTRDTKGPGLISQLLFHPVTNTSSWDTESYHQFAEGYGMRRSEMIWFINCYLNRPEDRLEPYASPLLCDDLSNLPPACIISTEFDVLRDDAEMYARKLKAAGNDVTCIRYNGMNHGFILRDGLLTNTAPFFKDDFAKIQKELFQKTV